MMRGSGAALAAFVLGACGGDVPPRCFALIDDGAGVLRPMAEGEPMPITHAPLYQWMVVMGLGAEGIDPGNPDDVSDARNPEYEAKLSKDEVELASRRGKNGFRRQADGTFALSDVRLVFGPDLPAAAGTPCELAFTLKDDESRTCATSVTVVPRLR